MIGATDPRDRVRLELVPADGLELLERVDQTEHAVGHEVGLVDGRRQAGGHARGHVLHERRVLQDQPLAGADVAGGLERVPDRGERIVDLRAARSRRRPGDPASARPSPWAWVWPWWRSWPSSRSPSPSSRSARRRSRASSSGSPVSPSGARARAPRTSGRAKRGCSAASWRRCYVRGVPARRGYPPLLQAGASRTSGGAYEARPAVPAADPQHTHRPWPGRRAAVIGLRLRFTNTGPAASVASAGPTLGEPGADGGDGEVRHRHAAVPSTPCLAPGHAAPSRSRSSGRRAVTSLTRSPEPYSNSRIARSRSADRRDRSGRRAPSSPGTFHQRRRLVRPRARWADGSRPWAGRAAATGRGRCSPSSTAHR